VKRKSEVLKIGNLKIGNLKIEVLKIGNLKIGNLKIEKDFFNEHNDVLSTKMKRKLKRK